MSAYNGARSYLQNEEQKEIGNDVLFGSLLERTIHSIMVKLFYNIDPRRVPG